jgi:hypothetical protein
MRGMSVASPLLSEARLPRPRLSGSAAISGATPVDAALYRTNVRWLAASTCLSFGVVMPEKGGPIVALSKPTCADINLAANAKCQITFLTSLSPMCGRSSPQLSPREGPNQPCWPERCRSTASYSSSRVSLATRCFSDWWASHSGSTSPEPLTQLPKTA